MLAEAEAEENDAGNKHTAPTDKGAVALTSELRWIGQPTLKLVVSLW